MSDQKSRAPKAQGAYPPAKRVGNLLFVSGQGSRDPETDELPGLIVDAYGNEIGYDIAAECHNVFKNVRNIVEDYGLRWEDIVDVTTFLTNLQHDFAGYNKLYAEYFGDVMPSRTTVGVAALPSGIHIELKVIAQFND